MRDDKAETRSSAAEVAAGIEGAGVTITGSAGTVGAGGARSATTFAAEDDTAGEGEGVGAAEALCDVGFLASALVSGLAEGTLKDVLGATTSEAEAAGAVDGAGNSTAVVAGFVT
jgi:hypothetical protein